MDNQDYVSLIIHNIMERKGIEHDQAYDLLMNQKEYIMQSFEHIEDIMQEIDSKNNKFIESAIHRITFLLNNQNDIEGKINNIIKSISSGNDIKDLGNIYINQMINRDSLYVPRQISKPMKTQDVYKRQLQDMPLYFIDFLKEEKMFIVKDILIKMGELDIILNVKTFGKMKSV